MTELTEFSKQLLKGKNFASVATIMPDGTPQVSVVWVDTDDKHIIFNTAEGRRKTLNMQSNPSLAIAVFNTENPYQQSMIRGKVVEIKKQGADDHVNHLAKKYLGVDKYPYAAPGEVRLIVKVAPEHIFEIGNE